MSAIVEAGRRLTVSATGLRDSMARMLAECERAHRPSGGGGSGGGGGRGGRRRRRVPTGEAGAALLGQILRGNPYVEGGPGTALPGTQATGPKGSTG